MSVHLARPRRARLLAAAAGLWLLSAGARADDVGGPGLEDFDRGLYEATGAIAPRHPVTGRPVLNVVPESLEIQLAQDFFRKYAEEARRRGAHGDPVDPPGRRLDEIRRVFAALVAVAHRPALPWEVHLVDDPTPNAFTAGGGLVVVLSGLYDAGFLRDGDEDGLAAVLAHEVAHVTLLHPPTRVTWLGVGGIVSPQAQDPYYRAAYTLEQEAEADRLSVLYLALAGWDPLAAARLWARVADGHAESAAGAGYLHDHPVNHERVRITRDAAGQVDRYFVRGRRNPRHVEILADNVLYPRNRDEGYRAGDGLLRAGTAILDSFRIHQRAARSRDERRAWADDLARVRVIGTWDGQAPDGGPGLVVDVWNGAARSVTGVGVVLSYWSDGALVLIEDCRGEVLIPPRATGTVTCARQGMAADRIEPRVAEVSWR